jgi:ParB family chromosome partitioning protein
LITIPTKAVEDSRAGGIEKINISDKLVNRIAQELQKLLGTKVAIDYHNQKGKVSIHFYSDDELSGLVEKLKKI